MTALTPDSTTLSLATSVDSTSLASPVSPTCSESSRDSDCLADSESPLSSPSPFKDSFNQTSLPLEASEEMLQSQSSDSECDPLDDKRNKVISNEITSPDDSHEVSCNISSSADATAEAEAEAAEIDWDSLCAVESRLVSEYEDAQLFVDQCTLKNKEGWDDQCLPAWPVLKLKNIISNSQDLPFHDIPNLPNVNYDDSELSLWAALIADYRSVAQKIPKYASMMVRSGIPPALRGHAWKAMAESASPTLESLYDSLAAEWTPFVKIIGRDLNRTFPEIKMFREQGGPGQLKLGRVLRAYSAYDIQVGYCQGLTFLAGPLLLHMDDKSAFCTLIQLMEDYDLRSMFTADMAGLQLRMYQFESLFSEYLPEIYEHFKSLNVSNIYASQWFLSFFAVTCPLSMLVRIFDLVFSEGAIPTLMRVALAVLGRNQRILMGFDDDEQILQHMLGRCIWDIYGLDADLLITDVAAVNVCSIQHLIELESEFNDGGKPHMTNNTNNYSKSTPDLSKRSMSATSTLSTVTAKSTSSTSTSASAPATTLSTPNPTAPIASYFTQFPWLRWQAPASPALPTAPMRPMSPAAAHSDTDLTTTYDRSRFSIASFDSMSTANSGSINSFDSPSNRGSRIYGHQSSVSSFTSYEGLTSSASSVSSKTSSSKSAKLVATLEENQNLKDKVSSLTAEIEKLRFELQQRERLSRVAEEERSEIEDQTESAKSKNAEPLSNDDKSSESCSSCEKLRLELALSKTNETLANAELEDLRHNLAKSKSVIASLTGGSGSMSSSTVTSPTVSSSPASATPRGSGSHNPNRRSLFMSSSNFVFDIGSAHSNSSKTSLNQSSVPSSSLHSRRGSQQVSDAASVKSVGTSRSFPAVAEETSSGDEADDTVVDTKVDSTSSIPTPVKEDKSTQMAASHSKGWSIW